MGEERFEHAQVDGFVAGVQGGGEGGVLLKLKDGEEIAIWTLAQDGLRSSGEHDAEQWEPVAARLNRLLDEHRPTTSWLTT